MSLIHTTRKLTPANQMKYRSKNGFHSLNEIYSLLFKSLRSGDEIHALYSVHQIPYKYLTKKILIIFLCENCPNIYVIRELYMTNPDMIDFDIWAVRICRMVKTRIVINAFRIVSFGEYKENDYSINSLIILPTPPPTANDDATIISLQQEKTLVKNAFIIWSLLSKNGLDTTMNEIMRLYYTIVPSSNPKGLLYKLYAYLDERYLDIIFIFLALISIPSYSLNLTQPRVNADIDPNLKIPEYIDHLPDYIYDLYSTSKKSNHAISYYFNNMKLPPSTRMTMTDKYGVKKFIQVNEPLETSINEYIKCKDFKVIKIARFDNERYSLASTHSTRIKYKYIITMQPIQKKAHARNFIFSEALKQDLGLQTLKRHIISHNLKYYIIQNNFLPITDTEDFAKNAKGQIFYTHSISTIYPEHIEFHTDDESFIIKFFTVLMYRKIIGFPIYNKYSLVLLNGEIYMLDDNLNKFYSKTITYPVLSTQTEVIMKQQLSIYWNTIHKTLKRWYKIISGNKYIPINRRIRILYEIKQLQDINNWKFSSV